MKRRRKEKKEKKRRKYIMKSMLSPKVFKKFYRVWANIKQMLGKVK